MSDHEVENPRKSRKDKLNRLREQIAAISECEDLHEGEEGDACLLAEELNSIKDHIRKRNDETVLAPCPE